MTEPTKRPTSVSMDCASRYGSSWVVSSTTWRPRARASRTTRSASRAKNDRWVFGDAASGAHLVKFSWTDIVRHTVVKGGASPDDPALPEYWAERRRRVRPPLDSYTLRLLTRQDGRCPLCGDELLSAAQPPQSPAGWERWWLQVVRGAIVVDCLVHHGPPGAPDGDQTRLVHAPCRRELQARQRKGTALQP
jgi:RNA-directed DNA polymerase